MKLITSIVIFVFGVSFASFWLGSDCMASGRDELFSVPSIVELPLQVKVLSKVSEEGIVVEELEINAPNFGGNPTMMYCFYAYPEAPGAYPGVVQLHGSGLRELMPKSAIEYAKNGFACISIDWAGRDWKGEGKIREAPRSDFSSKGSQAVFVRDNPDVPRRGKWVGVAPQDSSITNGVRFVRRAFQFLRSQSRVDAEQLCLSGMSAGAHLSLLVLGVEPDIKAAAVKYGSGYIRELNWGGYYGAISQAPSQVSKEWLSVLDPKHGFQHVNAATLILSGTDDIFFFMPAVLATWRSIPEQKTLLMFPNDSHSQVGNEEIPRQWFNHVLKKEPRWPSVGDIKVAEDGESLHFELPVSGDISQVSFYYKRMPQDSFRWGRAKTAAETVRWQELEAESINGNWSASLPVVLSGEQLVIYATAMNADNIKASSDTLEIPDYPKWRDTSN